MLLGLAGEHSMFSDWKILCYYKKGQDLTLNCVVLYKII
jgi:hypothetical protein